MWTSRRRARCGLLTLICCTFSFANVPAYGAVISTSEVLQAADRSVALSRVQMVLQRADVRRQLVALGVDPAAALKRVHFEPRETVLREVIRRAEGFSAAATAYFRRLGEFQARGAHLRADVESGELTDEAPIAEFVRQVHDFLAQQARQIGPIAFFTRYPLARPNAINCYIWQSVPERWGCSIRVYDPSRPDVPPKTIFRDPQGSIFDMNLSRNAKTLFFSYKRRSEKCWQLYF